MEAKLRRLSISCSVLLLIILSPYIHKTASACNKIGHDCETEIGRSDLKELPFRVARQKEFFAQEKVYPKLQSSDSKRRLESIVNGKALLAVATLTEIRGLIGDNRNVRLVSVLVTSPDSFLITTREIDQIPQLVGKKIAVTNDSQASYVHFAMSSIGIRNRNYSLVTARRDPKRLLAALDQKTADATIVPPFIAYEASRRGLRVQPLSRYMGSGIEIALVGTQDRLSKETEGVVRLLRSLKMAISWVYNPSNSSEVDSIISKEYNVSVDAATFIRKTILEEYKIYPSNVLNWDNLLTTSAGWLQDKRVGALGKFFDGSFAEKAGLMEK